MIRFNDDNILCKQKLITWPPRHEEEVVHVRDLEPVTNNMLPHRVAYLSSAKAHREMADQA